MVQLPQIKPGAVTFPETQSALDEPNGLLAFGGDLSVDQLVAAYRKGIFPWFDDESPILWWSPSPRLVVLPEEVHVSKSMRKILRKGVYRVTTDTAFERVIDECAAPRDNQGTWITEEMRQAYCELHDLGIAHSVEVWCGPDLVGGLYGVAIGAVYFGESMFSLKSNASKYGFITLALSLSKMGYQLIDCQVHSDHLESLGAKDITREAFEAFLANNVDRNVVWPTSEQLQIEY